MEEKKTMILGLGEYFEIISLRYEFNQNVFAIISIKLGRLSYVIRIYIYIPQSKIIAVKDTFHFPTLEKTWFN